MVHIPITDDCSYELEPYRVTVRDPAGETLAVLTFGNYGAVSKCASALLACEFEMIPNTPESSW